MTDSVDAYDIAERVRRYDADMDVMHPLRWRMIDVALEVLPFPRDRALAVLDLGVGTGAFTQRVLDAFPESAVVAVDGAEEMLKLAAARIGDKEEQVRWVGANFLSLPAEITAPDSYDLVISSYALHHLDAAQKQAVLRSAVTALKLGGWLLNADIVVADSVDVEARIQELRVAGITGRAAKGDARFESTAATRATLDDLEAAEQDQPQTLETDLAAMRAAGIGNAEVFWKELREVVAGGWKEA